MSELKKIYQATGPGDAHVLRGLLEAEGIAVVVRGDDFVPLQGGSLFTVETRPSLWVLDDDSYARARDLADHYASNAPERAAGVPARPGRAARAARRSRCSSPPAGAAASRARRGGGPPRTDCLRDTHHAHQQRTARSSGRAPHVHLRLRQQVTRIGDLLTRHDQHLELERHVARRPNLDDRATPPRFGSAGRCHRSR